MPRSSVNTGHFRVPRARGVFLAATVPRRGNATMTLRLSPYLAIGGYSPALYSPWLGVSAPHVLLRRVFFNHTILTECSFGTQNMLLTINFCLVYIVQVVEAVVVVGAVMQSIRNQCRWKNRT